MPPRRRKITRLRLHSFADVPKSVVVRWNLGLIDEDEEWASLFAAYGKVRTEYLSWRAVRFPTRTPGIETLYLGWLADGDVGAEEAAAELRRLERENDPRRALGATSSS